MKLSELLPSELDYLEKKVKIKINKIRVVLVKTRIKSPESDKELESYFDVCKKVSEEIEEEHKEELSILDEYLERINKAFMSFE